MLKTGRLLYVSIFALDKMHITFSIHPDIMILPSLAKILGVSIETLLTGEAETTYVPEENRKSFEETILYVHVKEGTENIQLNLPLPLLQTLLVDGGMS